jgi:hypothetical protein
MKTIQKAVLKEGYYADGMSVIMKESKDNWYYVYYYIHCEDRLSEYGMYKDYNEALASYENIIVTYC